MSTSNIPRKPTKVKHRFSKRQTELVTQQLNDGVPIEHIAKAVKKPVEAVVGYVYKHLYVIVPDGLEDDLRLYMTDGQATRLLEKCLWVVSTIKLQQYRNKNRPADTYHNLNWYYLRDMLGRDTGQVLRMLLSWAFIEQDNQIRPRVKSRGYRLGAKYRSRPTHNRELTTPKLIAAYRRFMQTRENRNPTLNRIHARQRETLSRLTIVADWKADLGELPHSEMENVRHIELGFYYYKPDRYGRAHTNLTNLWSVLRKYLRLDGMPLAFVDIVSSQPLFFGVWMRDLAENTIHTIQNKQTQTNPPISNDYTKWLLNWPTVLRAEIEEYLRAVLSGRFYEEIAEGLPCGWCRDKVKTEFFHALYGTPTDRNPVWVEFKRRFPTIGQFLKAFKQVNYYPVLARNIQTVEASFVFYRVVDRLQAHHPDIPLVTIHDSVGCPFDQIQTVYAVMEDEFRKLGLAAVLRTENADDKASHWSEQIAKYAERLAALQPPPLTFYAKYDRLKDMLGLRRPKVLKRPKKPTRQSSYVFRPFTFRERVSHDKRTEQEDFIRF